LSVGARTIGNLELRTWNLEPGTLNPCTWNLGTWNLNPEP